MRGVRLVVAGLALCLPSCVDFDGIFDICPDGCPPPPPQDCAVLQSAVWRVVPSGSSGNDVRLAVGESRAVSLAPFVESHCAATLAVTWSSGDPAIASVTTRVQAHRGAWVTGLRPGPVTVHARIVLPDGSAQQATPREFVVAPPDAAAGTIVAQGAIRLDRSPEWSRFVAFDLPEPASQVDVSVDWGSVLNEAEVFLFRGSCSATSICPGLEFIGLPDVQDRKPVHKSVRNLAAGPYSIRIDNLGPGAETVRYEVRFTR
jgi:hypothetical protein